MDSIVNEVKTILAAATAECAEKVENIESYREDIRAKKYTQDYINATIYPRIDALINSVKELKKQTETEAISKIDKYAEEARRAYRLDPAQITDDARLFTLGVMLNETDLQDIAERNADNPTMLQLVNRYAKENKINFNLFIPGARGEQALAQNLRDLTRRYIDKWIDKPSGVRVLDGYFTIPENRDGIE